jgi:hypothetical protein
MNFLQQLIELTVPLAKPEQGYTCSWWTPEVKCAVQQARAARRQGGPAEHLRAAIQNKRKAIRKTKTAKFREEVHKAATAVSSKGIWRFVRWAREKSHLPPEPPIIPPLRESTDEVMRIAVTPQEKVEMLKRHFFPGKLQADLSNMKEAHYLPEIEQLLLISAEDIQDLMAQQQLFSIPDADGIPNTFLRVLGKPFMEALAELTQTCWRVSYHPMRFHKARRVTLCKRDKEDYINLRA